MAIEVGGCEMPLLLIAHLIKREDNCLGVVRAGVAAEHVHGVGCICSFHGCQSRREMSLTVEKAETAFCVSTSRSARGAGERQAIPSLPWRDSPSRRSLRRLGAPGVSLCWRGRRVAGYLR